MQLAPCRRLQSHSHAKIHTLNESLLTQSSIGHSLLIIHPTLNPFVIESHILATKPLYM